MNVRLKICCIASREEAKLAIQYDADALGLVSKMPSGPGPIEETLIAEIAAFVPPPVATFLLTSETDVEHIIAQHRRCLTSVLQIVDRMEKGTYDRLRAELSGIKIVQVIHVNDEESLNEALEASERGADALLLDSGDQRLAVKLLGGTGRVHDWSISRRIVEQVSIPVFLAGGLNSENVRSAINEVGPFGIDVCSGVRTSGKLDETKLSAFVESMHNA
jgi:phosphoribosylanthranilate isomerase